MGYENGSASHNGSATQIHTSQPIVATWWNHIKGVDIYMCVCVGTQLRTNGYVRNTHAWVHVYTGIGLREIWRTCLPGMSVCVGFVCFCVSVCFLRAKGDLSVEGWDLQQICRRRERYVMLNMSNMMFVCFYLMMSKWVDNKR